MDGISAAATSDSNRQARVPPCVGARAEELLELAVLRFLAWCLGAVLAIQLAALMVILLLPPHLHFIPEVG